MNIPIQDPHQPTRPATPDSIYSATPTIEDLTTALAEFSQRVPSPDPPLCLTCCCGKEDCENLSNWLATKGRLETRLRLSAEVGQALLRRHEAYTHRHETPPKRQSSMTGSVDTITSFVVHGSQEERDSYVVELIREKALLEKRLNQALVNNEVSEASTKSVLQELEEARATISRLTATQARSTGWDVRLSAAMKEKNDIQQERDVESQRAKLAESRFAALKEKAVKLQTEVHRLQEALESKRVTNMESSDCTLQDARTQIQLMQNGQLSRNEHDELARVLESLVNDNEILKRDNAELQQLLSDCREDFHAMREEVEEQRLHQEMQPGTLAHKLSTAPSFSIKEFSIPVPDQRSTSVDRSSRAFEPLTPETNHRPLSPTTHLSTSSDPRLLHHPPDSGGSLCPTFQISYDLDPDNIHEDDESMGKPIPIKPTPTRSRGVQMNGTCIPFAQFRYLSPYDASLHPPPFTSSDPRSESSSFSSETLTSHIAILLERLTQLFSKLAQADALTLTNRLKRQHLYHNPGDVKHLSRSTVNQIMADTAALRSQFRVLLEDEKVVTVCTRKEVRALFRLMKEMFGEMGRLRVVLNDVILDPSQAPRVSEAAMDPKRREDDSLGAGSKDGWDNWIGPLSKLFSAGGKLEKRQTEDRLSAGPPLSKSVSNQSGVSGVSNLSTTGAMGVSARPRQITVPKNAPALAASATTVNVEFLGAGSKGKTVTNTFSRSDGPVLPMLSVSPDNHNTDWQTQNTFSGVGGSKNVMDIFAGAPPKTLEHEPWIVLPKTPRKARSSIIRMGSNMDTTGRTSPTPQPTIESGAEDGLGRVIGGLSRYVDAVIDPVFGHATGPSDYLPTFQSPPSTVQGQQDSVSKEELNQVGEQSIRPRLRRGLSDSSIHSTFSSQAMDEERSYPRSPVVSDSGPSVGVVPNRQPRFPAMWPDRQSVLQALSRTMQNFRLGQGANSTKARTVSSTAAMDTNSSGVPSAPQRQPQSPTEGTRVSGENRGAKTDERAEPRTPRKGLRVKPRSSTPVNLGVSYYENPVPGSMGTAALLNSLPARASMRDPFVWEA